MLSITGLSTSSSVYFLSQHIPFARPPAPSHNVYCLFGGRLFVDCITSSSHIFPFTPPTYTHTHTSPYETQNEHIHMHMHSHTNTHNMHTHIITLPPHTYRHDVLSFSEYVACSAIQHSPGFLFTHTSVAFGIMHVHSQHRIRHASSRARESDESSPGGSRSREVANAVGESRSGSASGARARFASEAAFSVEFDSFKLFGPLMHPLTSAENAER